MRSRIRRRDDGAALVEFAVVAPVLLMLVFAIITGGLAFSRDLAITHAAQQTARYGSTLPVSSYASTDDWLDALAERVLVNATDELDEAAPGRRICVAFVHPDDGTVVSRTVTTSDLSPVYVNSACFDDDLPDDEPRVQVELERDDEIDLVVFGNVDLDLNQRAIAQYQVDD